MKTQNKPTTVTNANKTFKSKGKKGQKRIDKTQQSGSRSGARPPPSKANGKKISVTVTLPTPGGLCSFCRFRQHTNDNNGRDDNRSLLVEVEKVEVFKKFMKELGYLGSGSGDKGFGDDEDVKYCWPCEKAMESVLGHYNEILKALSAVLDNATGGGEDNNEREKSEMSTIVVKEEFEVEMENSSSQGDFGEEDFLTPESSLSTEMEATAPAGDPLDEALGKPEELENESQTTPIVVKDEEFHEDTSSYQEDVGEEGFLSPQSPLTSESETEAPQAEDPEDEALDESEIDRTNLPCLRSSLTTKVLHWKDDGYYDPEDLLSFFENGEGRKTEVISLKFDHFNRMAMEGYEGLTLGRAFIEILKNRWAPALKELNLRDLDLRGSRDYLYEDCDFSKSLKNLEVLTVTSCQCWKEKEVLGGGGGSPFFLNVILRGAGNLRELHLQGPFFPEQSAIEKLKNLKLFHFDLKLKRNFLGSPPPSLIPEFERVLFQVSTNCVLLEELRLHLLSDYGCFPEIAAIGKLKKLKSLHLDLDRSYGYTRPELERFLTQVSTNCLLLEEFRFALPSQEMVKRFNFPTFPQLEKFVWSLNGLSFMERDFIRFLKEKMPNLRSCTVSGSYSTEQLVDSLLRGFQSSKGKHKGLKFLSIPASEDFILLEDFKAKFPSLKRLKVNAEHFKWVFGPIVRIQKERENRLAGLAVAVANEFPSIPVTLEGLGIADGENVKKKFWEKVGPQYKGTFIAKFDPSMFPYKEIQLIPEKKTSKV